MPPKGKASEGPPVDTDPYGAFISVRVPSAEIDLVGRPVMLTLKLCACIFGFGMLLLLLLLLHVAWLHGCLAWLRRHASQNRANAAAHMLSQAFTMTRATHDYTDLSGIRKLADPLPQPGAMPAEDKPAEDKHTRRPPFKLLQLCSQLCARSDQVSTKGT